MKKDEQIVEEVKEREEIQTKRRETNRRFEVDCGSVMGGTIQELKRLCVLYVCVIYLERRGV